MVSNNKRMKTCGLLFALVGWANRPLSTRSAHSISIILAACTVGILAARAAADEPTLARLSFWLPTERMAEFAQVYESELAPFLEERGFVASVEPGRATVDSVFSRLFVFETPAAVEETRDRLERDPAWLEITGRTAGVYGA